MTKELEQQVREKEEVIKADIDAEIYRQAETERELAASHHAAAKVQTARLEAAKKFQEDIQLQMEEKEKEKEFAYQQESYQHTFDSISIS